MPKKVELKTQKTTASVSGFIAGLKDPLLQKESRALVKLFKSATGLKPKMWGPSLIGFGEYTYRRSNGDEGCFFATGFSPRKSGPVIYIMPGYEDYGAILKNLGPHKRGKSCLYLKGLEGIDLKVLAQLISRGLRDLRKFESRQKRTARKAP